MLPSVLISLRDNGIPAALLAICAAVCGLAAAVAEHHDVPRGRWSALVGPSLILFLFYPRSIVYTLLTQEVTNFWSSSFAQSIWGLVLVNIPVCAGLAYLVFSVTLNLERFSAAPAAYLRNSGGVRTIKLILAGSTPFHPLVFAVIGLIFCFVLFQGSTIGIAGPRTLGVFLTERLNQSTVSLVDVLGVLAVVVVTLTVAIIVVPLLLTRLGQKLANASLHVKARNHERRRDQKVVFRSLLSLSVVIIVSASAILHVMLVLRIFQPEHSSTAEQVAACDLSFVVSSIQAASDFGVGGGMLGSLMVLATWMTTARRSTLQSDAWRLLIPLVLAAIAFMPSNFMGAITLALIPPQLGASTTLNATLLVWGAITGAALTALLISGRLISAKLYRYDNIDRLRGRLTYARVFIAEYSAAILALIYIATFTTMVDAGFRSKLGIGGQSIGGQFFTVQGEWSPQQRGLALVLCVAATAILFVSRKGSREKTFQER